MSIPRDEILRMAREAGLVHKGDDEQFLDQLSSFAAMVAAVEREACAQAAEQTPTCLLPTGAFLSERVAAAIRAGGAAC